MNFLKRLPIKYTGELHDVRLINFSVAPEELKAYLPANIRPRLFDGRALISMVDVQLKNMHPDFMPSFFKFNYRHIAFRLLIDDSSFTEDKNKGIFFMHAFTDQSLIAFAGAIFTNYRLKSSNISDRDGKLFLKQGGKYITYTIDDQPATLTPPWVKENVQRVDRAYALSGDKIQYVQIQREKWPVEWVNCTAFKTDFFKTATLEGAFRVNEVIYYQWLPPQTIHS
jgi:hypothetical protein